MAVLDYYEIMGVEKDASSDDIKKSYRRLARKYHPDVTKDADGEEKFKQLGEAYEVLKDPDKRAEYDSLVAQGAFRGDQFRPPPGWESNAGFADGGYTEVDPSQFSDIFETIFRGGRGSRGNASPAGGNFVFRGEDIHANLSISLHEAFAGATRNLTLDSPRLDEKGELISNRKTLKTIIPAGVTDGKKIRLRSQGQQGINGGENGDLIIEIRLEPDKLFAVDERDLTLVLPISPWEAMLGTAIEVPTLESKLKVTIRAGAKAGQKLRLKGKGLPGEPPGDLFIVLKIVLPEVKSAADKELLEKMKQQMDFDPRAEMEA